MGTYKINFKRVIQYLKGDIVLLSAMAAMIVSSIFVSPSKQYLKYLDWRVICLLLSLMLVVSGLQKAGVFEFIVEYILRFVHNTRMLVFALISVCFFSSMLITNDVALITFVPLGIMLLTRIQQKELLVITVVLQTIAANLGSMFTPFGNPQNLYIYSAFNMGISQFTHIMFIPSAVSFLMLSASVFLIKSKQVLLLSDRMGENISLNKVVPWILLFAVCILAVLRIIPYGIALAAVVAGVLIIDRKMLVCADYGLLFTFAFLFVFIGNIKNIPTVSNILSDFTNGNELTLGILLSQVISNVPAAMLLSKFTENYDKLLLGVNLGGLGTLIASMASLISYKLYAATEHARKGRYVLIFTVVNVIFLGVLWCVTSIYM